MDKFQEFCENVCANTPRATEPERRAITGELTAHMEDHFDAMVARGVPNEEAMERAVAEMGDPREIGQGLNAALSPFWLWVSRIAAVLLALLAVSALLPLIATGMNIYDNLEARMTTADDLRGANDTEIVYTDSDLRFEVDGHIIRLLRYGTCTNCGEYGVHLDMVTYSKSIFGYANPELLRWVRVEDDSRSGGGRSNSGGAYWDSFTPVERGTPQVTLSFDRYGYRFEAQLPLDWGDNP